MFDSRKCPEIAKTVPEFVKIVYDEKCRPIDVKIIDDDDFCIEPNGGTASRDHVMELVPQPIVQKPAIQKEETKKEPDKEPGFVAIGLANVKNQILGLEEQLKSIRFFSQKRFDAVDGQMSRLTNEYVSVLSGMDVINNRFGSLTKSIDVLNSVQSANEKAISENIQILGSRMSTLENEVTKNAVQAVQNNEKLNSVIEETKNLAVMGSETDKKVAGLTETAIELKNDFDMARNDVGVLREDVKTIGECLNAARENLGTMKDEMAYNSFRTDAALGSIEANVSELSKKVDDSVAELSIGLDNASHKIETVSENMSESVDALSERISAMAVKQNESEAALFSNMDKIRDDVGSVIIESQDTKRCMGQLSSKQTELSDIQGELLLKQAEVEEKVCEMSELQPKLQADMKQELESVQSKQDSLDRKMEGLGLKQDEAVLLVKASVDELSSKQEEAISKAVDKAVEKASRKYTRLITKLTKKEKKPSRAGISKLIKKRLNLQPSNRLLIVSDRTNIGFAEVLFDVARKNYKNAVLSVMDNRKDAVHEPEEAISDAMSKADFVVITAKYSLEKTRALSDFVSQGKKAVGLYKSLRIIPLSQNAVVDA